MPHTDKFDIEDAMEMEALAGMGVDCSDPEADTYSERLAKEEARKEKAKKRREQKLLDVIVNFKQTRTIPWL
jgi:hypothetical protein